MVSAALRAALAPTGILRAGINLSNFLLVSSRGPNGEPVGVAPDMAASLARRIRVPLQLVPYANPGLLGDAATRDEWDVGLIGAEPKRAETIAFTAPYAEIEATFMVLPDRGLDTVADVDRPGVRVCVSARAAYDLWLTANLQSASLTRTEEPGLDRSRKLFDSGEFDALAGLRPWLLDQARRLALSRALPGASARFRTQARARARALTGASPSQVETAPAGTRVLDGSFTSVQQAIGTPRARGDGGATLFLEQFVAEAKASRVASLIEKHGQTGRLVVPQQ
mgnify:CR=1 FL=1